MRLTGRRRDRRPREQLAVPVVGYHLLSYEDADLQTHVLALVRVQPEGNAMVRELLGTSPQAARIVCWWSVEPLPRLDRVGTRLTAVVDSDTVGGVFELRFELPRDEAMFRVVAEEGRMVLALDGPEEIDGELRAPLPHVSFSLSAAATAEVLDFAARLMGTGRDDRLDPIGQ